MKPTLRKSIPHAECSFVIRKDVGTDIRTDWHYHPDYELVLIKRSRGTWLVGDYVGPFKTGDIILIGPDLPHSYRHEKEYLDKRDKGSGEVIAALFLKEILGEPFLSLPEANGINNVLLLCGRGLKLIGKTKFEAGKIMNSMLEASPGRKLINMLSILQLISDEKEFEVLASGGYTYESSGVDNARLSAILEYTFNHYQNQITIDEVAALVNMSKYTFSRFFKEKTKKTYIQFLMEVRIGKACRLLIEEDMNITEVCYACGYNNISHFNHQFKDLKHKSPYEFKQDYINCLSAK